MIQKIYRIFAWCDIIVSESVTQCNLVSQGNIVQFKSQMVRKFISIKVSKAKNE